MPIKLECTLTDFTYVPAEAGDPYFCQEVTDKTPALLGVYEPQGQ